MDSIYSVLFFLAFAYSTVSLITYILKAKALSRMVRNAGMTKSKLAWLPVANSWLLGSLCERSARFQAGNSLRFAWILFLLDAVKVIGGSSIDKVAGPNGGYQYAYHYNFTINASLRSLVAIAAAFGLLVFSAIALYHLYRDYAPERAGLYTALSMIFGGIGQGILLFLLRDCIPVSAASQMVPPPPCRKYSQLWHYGPSPYGGAYPPLYQNGPRTTGWNQPPYQGGPETTGWTQPPYQGGPGTTGWNQPPYQGGPETTGWNQPPYQNGPVPAPPEQAPPPAENVPAPPFRREEPKDNGPGDTQGGPKL